MRGNKKRGRTRRLLGLIVIVLGLLYLLLQLPFYLLNSYAIQQWLIHSYRPFAPWQLQIEKLHVKPWRFQIAVQKLQLTHPNGHRIDIAALQTTIKPLRFFFRGQFSLDPLLIESPTITIAESPKSSPEERKKRFKLRTAYFLKNLLLDHTSLKSVTLNLPHEQRLTIENLGVSLEPILLGGSHLALFFSDVVFQKASGTEERLKTLTFKVETNLDNWSRTFPYVDDVKGEIFLKQAKLNRFDITEAKANLLYKNRRLEAKNYTVQLGNNKLVGNLETDFNTQAFKIDIDTPDPLPIPELGSEWRTFDIAGNLKAKMELEGQGFQLPSSRGRGVLQVSHQFLGSQDFPVDGDLAFQWQNGTLSFQKATLSTGDASIDIHGSIDLKPIQFHLTMAAEKFPTQRFFEKFRDKNLHPILGWGTFQASLEGFGKTLLFKLKGTAQEGGYGTIRAEKAEVDLTITLEQLKLEGNILTEGTKTGEALFLIDYGPRLASGRRSKKISLEAKFMEQPLSTTFPNYSLTGLADATLHLDGINDAIQGKGTLRAIDVGFIGQGFDILDIHFSLDTKKLIIEKCEYTLMDATGQCTHPLTMDFIPGGFRLEGQPITGLDIQTTYQNESKQWNIQKLEIKEPLDPSLAAHFQGTVSPTAINLKATGTIDLAKIKWVTREIREASGPVALAMNFTGSPTNILANGTLTFQNNLVAFRAIPFAAEELHGSLAFHGDRIETKDLTGLFGTGTFFVTGFITHTGGHLHSYDIHFGGEEIYYRNAKGNFRMEYDANLTLKGPANNAMLAGSLTILDGRYTKDFNIIEEFKIASQAPIEIRQAALEGLPLHLDLDVRNLGDLIIDNNVGRIELNTNLHIKGTKFAPRVEGSIEVTEGMIKYLGVNLDITRGYMEFRDPNINPYLEINAEKEIADVHITATLLGYTDNLRIDFAGNSARGTPLEKKDVLSLILFGMTHAERAELSLFGPEVAYERIASVLQQPIERWTRLDIFRLESAPSQEGNVQSFHLGKRVSDRFIVEFASEINRDDAVQTFQLEYWLTDFFLLKAARSTHDDYQLNAGVRFKGR